MEKNVKFWKLSEHVEQSEVYPALLVKNKTIFFLNLYALICFYYMINIYLIKFNILQWTYDDILMHVISHYNTNNIWIYNNFNTKNDHNIIDWRIRIVILMKNKNFLPPLTVK